MPLEYLDKNGSMIIMVWLNATFNNISVISWRSVSLMEETGVPGENHMIIMKIKFKQ